MAAGFNLDAHGISVSEIHRNATPAFLYEAALRHEKGSAISSTGALVAYSGKKTGRSPADKRGRYPSIYRQKNIQRHHRYEQQGERSGCC